MSCEKKNILLQSGSKKKFFLFQKKHIDSFDSQATISQFSKPNHNFLSFPNTLYGFCLFTSIVPFVFHSTKKISQTKKQAGKNTQRTQKRWRAKTRRLWPKRRLHRQHEGSSRLSKRARKRVGRKDKQQTSQRKPRKGSRDRRRRARSSPESSLATGKQFFFVTEENFFREKKLELSSKKTPG